MNNLKPEIITFLDKIIDELDNAFELKNEAILTICNNDPKKAETICKILEADGWIRAVWINGLKYPGQIERSDSFSGKLSYGNYATREKLKKENSESLRIVNHITVTNSNFAFGNTAPVYQTIKINHVTELIEKAIKETEQSNDIQPNEKEEIIELLKDLNNFVKQGYEPPKSIIKLLSYYSEKVITIGASILTILSAIKG
jgi:hypothetical protein